MIKKGYAKVLYHLFNGSKTMSQLARLTGYNRKDLRRIVSDLEELGVVKVIELGTMKLVVIRDEARCLKELIIRELERSSP